jgi:hypothetical protein
MDNTVPKFLEGHFPEWVPPNERKLGATKRCVVHYKKKKRERQGFGVLNVRLVCVLRAASRPTTPSSGKIYIISINLRRYSEYSVKVSLKSLKNWGCNALLNQI